MKALTNSTQSAKVLSPRNITRLIFSALVVAAGGNTAGAQPACPTTYTGATVAPPPSVPYYTMQTVSAEAISPGGKYLWLAGFSGVPGGPGVVQVVNLKDLTLTKTLSLGGAPAGGGPVDIAFSPSGDRVFVSDYDTHSVFAFDGNSLEFVLNIPVFVPVYPYAATWGVVADADHILVTNFDSTIGGSPTAAELDSSGRVEEEIYIPVGNYVGDLSPGIPSLIPATGTFHAGQFLIPAMTWLQQANLALVDPANGQVVKYHILDPAQFGYGHSEQVGTGSVAVSPEGKYAYASVGGSISGVWVVSLKGLTTKTFIPVSCGTPMGSVAMSADGKHLLVVGTGRDGAGNQATYLNIIDTATETLEGSVLLEGVVPATPIGDPPLVITGGGSRAFVGGHLVTFDPPL
jgi:DNA-binding beta-propeller fold protein YncE